VKYAESRAGKTCIRSVHEVRIMTSCPGIGQQRSARPSEADLQEPDG
jgi:hypothetical protein